MRGWQWGGVKREDGGGEDTHGVSEQMDGGGLPQGWGCRDPSGLCMGAGKPEGDVLLREESQAGSR